ncbi:uncharacterized protein PRCAT00003570001 [Priceomyces carsonii]|uniref:uncharacterized protein n=1 Tax=Priceomyces carsonii TaxID=28549 RepID=UPI002EDBB313|nr:unnamed protein product [Priceomyces carsonii]
MPGNLNLKKSWHPGLMKNQQKVWEEEQNKLAELKKIKEKNKEIQDEKEKLQLMKMQYGDDLENLPSDQKLKLNKLDWMYDEPSKKDEAGFNEMRDEFLLGKTQVEQMLHNSNALRMKGEGKLNKIIAAGTVVPSSKVDLDDPLTIIENEQMKKKRQRKRREGENNRKRSHSHRLHRDERYHRSHHNSRSSRDESPTRYGSHDSEKASRHKNSFESYDTYRRKKNHNNDI